MGGMALNSKSITFKTDIAKKKIRKRYPGQSLTLKANVIICVQQV